VTDDEKVDEELDEKTDVESEESELVPESGSFNDDSVAPEKTRKQKKQTIQKDRIDHSDGRNAGHDCAPVNGQFHQYMNQQHKPHNINSHISPPKSNIPGFYPQQNPPHTNITPNNPTPILNPAK
jgi:hypothetical protein